MENKILTQGEWQKAIRESLRKAHAELLKTMTKEQADRLIKI